MEQVSIDIPQYAKKVIERLEANGYEAYAVGGCVRDSFMGRKPNDWDVTTSAYPEVVMNLFGGGRFRAYPTGIAHGTVTVLSSGKPVEVTTYRIDGEYRDSRRPESVDFNAGLSDDLARRDFTVNAMAYSPKRGLCDIFHGCEDLRKRILRCVGEPEKRFSEDALRILRAVRFAAVLGFAIEENTAKAAVALRDTLNVVSRERIQAELVKLLYGKYASRLISDFSMIFDTILPNRNPQAAVFIDKIHSLWKTLGENFLLYNMGENHTIEDNQSSVMKSAAESVPKLPPKKNLMSNGLPLLLAATVSGNHAESLLDSLRLDKKTRKRTLLICSYADYRLSGTDASDKIELTKLCATVGWESAWDIVTYAVAVGNMPSETVADLVEIRKSNVCISVSELAVKGSDLQKIGYQGDEIGQELKRLLYAVIETHLTNEKQSLLAFAVSDKTKENE